MTRLYQCCVAPRQAQQQGSKCAQHSALCSCQFHRHVPLQKRALKSCRTSIAFACLYAICLGQVLRGSSHRETSGFAWTYLDALLCRSA